MNIFNIGIGRRSTQQYIDNNYQSSRAFHPSTYYPYKTIQPLFTNDTMDHNIDSIPQSSPMALPLTNPQLTYLSSSSSLFTMADPETMPQLHPFTDKKEIYHTPENYSKTSPTPPDINFDQTNSNYNISSNEPSIFEIGDGNGGLFENLFSNSFLNDQKYINNEMMRDQRQQQQQQKREIYDLLHSSALSNTGDCRCEECLSMLKNNALNLYNINISNRIGCSNNYMSSYVPDIISSSSLPFTHISPQLRVLNNNCVVHENYDTNNTRADNKYLPTISPTNYYSEQRNYDGQQAAKYHKKSRINSRRLAMDNKSHKKKMRILKNNDRVHHSCHWCAKQFFSNYEIQRHYRIHNGERPFPCSICKKRFRQKQHMITHISTVHANNRPYTCPNCKKCFKEKGTMTKHIQYTHLLKTRPLKCPKCQHSFKRKGNLKSHLKKIHEIYGESLQLIVEQIVVQPVTYSDVIHNLNKIKIIKNEK